MLSNWVMFTCVLGITLIRPSLGKNQDQIREFGIDENFGNSLETNGGTNANKPKCPVACKHSHNCCEGQKCKRYWPGSEYGYCAKECLPANPGESCRRCLYCTPGYTCTVLLNRNAEQEYLCIRRKNVNTKRA